MSKKYVYIPHRRMRYFSINAFEDFTGDVYGTRKRAEEWIKSNFEIIKTTKDELLGTIYHIKIMEHPLYKDQDFLYIIREEIK